MRTSASLTLPLFTPEASAPESAPAPASAVFLVARPANEPPRAELEALVARVNGYAEDVRARATRRAYESDFRTFEAWCGPRGLVAVYLAALAGEGRRPTTIGRALAGIAFAHRERGCL
jgi:NhaP-type Na+/H+ or K+/H+ antiporter